MGPMCKTLPAPGCKTLKVLDNRAQVCYSRNMNTPTFTLRLPVEIADKLKALSTESGLPVAQLIIACVNRALPYVESKAREAKQP